MKRSSESLHLDSVNRIKLDFDFEKVCSVSLSTQNIYACLVCGKYFQGRNSSSPAYFHSLDISHHVYINLTTCQIYVLPDGYLVSDTSFDDIKYEVNPKYTLEMIRALDNESKASLDLSKNEFIPGTVGLNNIKRNDYMNVVVHLLSTVNELRNFLLLNTEFKSELLKRMSILTRKMWNSKAFKGHVSPHEFIQQVSLDSKKKFTIIEQGQPHEFLLWLLHFINSKLPKSDDKPSLIHQLFQGNLVKSQDEKIVSFICLSLELPPPRLFEDEFERAAPPQVSIDVLLEKYSEGQEYAFAKLPKYLIIHFKRFIKNRFVSEKNSTIVNFNLDKLLLGDERFKLLANIVHDSDTSRYKIYVKRQSLWYEIDELSVKQVNASTVFLSETYLQLWKRF